ncbi:c2 domain-containing protein [Ditylenchus destructor]|nr:c2 domain-containing protein [Ditylenchus destructor]
MDSSNNQLYALIIRAILNHEDYADLRENESSKKAATKKAPKSSGLIRPVVPIMALNLAGMKPRSNSQSHVWGSSGPKNYELAEIFRQIVGFSDVEHQRIVQENETCLSYSLNISIESAGILGVPQKYLVQLSKSDDKTNVIEEQFVDGTESFIVNLPHGRRSIVRLSPTWCALEPSTASAPPSPGGGSIVSSCSQYSPASIASTSNVSNESIEVADQSMGSRKFSQPPKISIPHHDEEHSLVARSMSASLAKSPLARSGSFIKKWVRGYGRSNSYVTIRVKTLAIDETQSLRIPSSPPAKVSFMLKKSHIMKEDTKGLEISELLTLLRFIRTLTLETRSGELSDGTTTDDGSLAISDLDTTTLALATEEIIRRVASCYNFSRMTVDLLSAGIILEEGKGNLRKISESNIAADLREHFLRLRSCALIAENKPQECKAASFLAEAIVAATEALIRSVSVELFFPIKRSFGDEFQCFSFLISPIIDIVKLSLWDSHYQSEVGGRLQATITRMFQNAVQAGVAIWLHEELFCTRTSSVTSASSTISKMSIVELCDLIDQLHLALKQFGPIYEAFFERVCFPYIRKVLQIIDDPLSVTCQSCLNERLRVLNPRDTDELVTFTKSSMKLFDALGEFAEMTKLFGERCAVQNFEPWFEQAAIFWSSSWRLVYMDYIRKCVDESRMGMHESYMISSSTISEQDQRDFVAECKQGIELHDSTVNCLAFCKALCDDFIRLRAQHRCILLLGSLQITAILVDCLGSFVAQVLHQLKMSPSPCKMIQTANGIEHASTHLAQNFERFLDIPRLVEALGEESERGQAISSIKHMMSSARARCRAIADQIIESWCNQKNDCIRRYCSLITKSSDAPKKTLGCYFRQVFTNEPEDQLLVFLDKTCRQLHERVLPRLYATARMTLWNQAREIIEKQLLPGQPSEYYQNIDKACESICHILQVDWNEEHSSLRRKLHINRAETLELILQYYGSLAERTMIASQQRPASPTPRVCLRIGYIHSTNRQILLHIHVLCAYDIPVLDALTQSSDPYLRLELYPHCFFPLTQYPAVTTETKKQTLNPKWNEVFQIAVPDELFFTNGVCLCLTILDHDIMSYNDLAGQAFLPLARMVKLKSLSSKQLPSPLVVPLLFHCPNMPSSSSQYNEHFQILEQRSKKDSMAREVTTYEKYLRDYRILPPSAHDDKDEWSKGLKETLTTIARSKHSQLRNAVNHIL